MRLAWSTATPHGRHRLRSIPAAELLKSPRLPLYVEEPKRTLAAERARRQRFYRETPEDRKAEFINGEAVLNPPARLEHISAGKLLLALLEAWVQSRGLDFVGYEKLMIPLTRNDYEPDICFFAKAKARRFKRAQTRFPAPDLIVEVSWPATASTSATLSMLSKRQRPSDTARVRIRTRRLPGGSVLPRPRRSVSFTTALKLCRRARRRRPSATATSSSSKSLVLMHQCARNTLMP